jgi:hypothetical protein
MDLDLHVSRFDWAGDATGIGPGVADLARRAEGLGVRTFSFMDHYFQMDWMAPADDPTLEGYTALGFVAGVTERIRLRLLVTGVTYRHPGLLAKIVTTLDVLSGGRAELGIGAAWYEREHDGLGVTFPPPPSASSVWKRPSALPCRCGATTMGRSKARTTSWRPRCAGRCRSASLARACSSAAGASARRCAWSPSTPTPAI